MLNIDLTRTRLDDCEYVILDFETTGVFPAQDRAIEVALVRVTPSGTVTDSYSTLINAERDVGAQHIHGITARDLRDAPQFADIVGDIASRLHRAVVVAHNALFDTRFLLQEFKRCDIALPRFPVLCTMTFANRLSIAADGRSLGALCECYGVTLADAHSALGDATATAGLLAKCLARALEEGCETLGDLGVGRFQSPALAWPDLPRSGRSVTRDAVRCQRDDEPSPLVAILNRLPLAGRFPPQVESYLALLDRVLTDRRITADEADGLFQLATDLGLGREQVINAHQTYLIELAHACWTDGVLTSAETCDFTAVAKLLSIPPSEATRILENAAHTPERTDSSRLTDASLAGKSICFTGELSASIRGKRVERDTAEELAITNGLIIKSGVSKKLDFLVAADPDSMSGKARKARELGVTILAEPVFWRMMGVSVE